ncbi:MULTISPECIES: hypothetical protein [Winogradskyella]|jgi:hypothetical protein|uniref:hypothetical protein n=1 Tax=Winogradskyella TaxID=286104 RepID=UPI0015CA314F|nr:MULTISPECIES: hypothetical protein [Winogradskyella]QXP78847.1 hypothetical protein H0I32_16825 [Winogradskyella sp. HaHa_3_26]
MKIEIKEQLDKVFQAMRANMSKVDLLSMYSHSIFNDFPANLPEKTLKQYKTDLDILKKAKIDLTQTEFNLLTEEKYIELGTSKEFYRFVQNYSTAELKSNELKSPDYEQVLFGQELISLYSFLEGYFQDLQRLLFLNDKTLLSNKDKEIGLDKILKADNYDELISIIIEEKLEKSGYEKISTIISKWKKEPFKIIIKLKKDELEELDKYTSIRNIIIHNNSKINESLLNYLDNEKFKIGQTFELNTVLMKKFRDLVFEIVFNAYLEINAKYPMIVELNEKHSS